MKKERILYFDVIKLLAVILVFSCHFNRTLEYGSVYFTFKVLPDYIFSLYTGSLGVTLFFIISGASLMYVYDEHISLKDYYKKRFLGIYPMFWIAYILFFCVNFYINKGFDRTIPLKNFIFTLFGCDGAAEFYTRTFHQLGEWFLIVIVLLYAVFPLLRALLKRIHPALLYGVVLGICLLISFNYKAILPMDVFFVNRIPEFLFGMIFIKYIKKVNIFMFIPAVICLATLTLVDFPTLNGMVRIYVVGISLFLVLVYVFSRIKWNIIKTISAFISRYCYPIFLVHHQLMIILIKNFIGSAFTMIDILILYGMTAGLTLICAHGLDRITKRVLGALGVGRSKAVQKQ